MEYVIIGNSTAGIAAAESIRKLDQAGNITILSDEAFPTYGRPLISYYLLGKTDAAHMNYRPADFYRKNNIRTMFSVRAEHIDAAKKQVLLQGGKKVKYDKLLVATGSRPFVPPMEGLDKNEYFTFMTYADALALEKQLAPEKNVLIVGAGLIGLKCLEGIADRVGKVTVVDMAPHILPSILDDYGASIIQNQLEKHGAEFYLSDSVASFEKGVAHLKSGATVPFDILVVAAGVRPNVELVKEAGGKVGPVDMGEGSAVGIEVTSRSAEFAADGHGLQQPYLLLQAIGEYPHLFSQPCGRGRLSVRPCQHAHLAPFFGLLANLVDDALQGGQDRVFQAFLEHQRLGGVVDVLRSKPEVHEFLEALQAPFLETGLDEVFHRLHIVVGGLFDFLDFLGIGIGKVPVEIPQILELLLGESGEGRDVEVAKGDEVFYFYPETVADQSPFGEVFPQWGGLVCVTAVAGRYGVKMKGGCWIFHYSVFFEKAGFSFLQVLYGLLERVGCEASRG